MTDGWVRALGDQKRAITLILAAGILHGLLLVYVPTGRFLKYTLAAEQWLAGELPIERWIDFSPLLFHLAVSLEHFGDSALWLARMQVALVAVCAGLAYKLIEPSFGSRWATAGALVLALDQHLVIYGRMIEPEIWLLALVLGALVAVERDRWASAGVLLALALFVRPTVLPLILLFPVWRWLRRGGTEEEIAAAPGERAGIVRAMLLFWVPCGLALITLAWRAQAASESWTTPSMNPGTVLFEGHNPASRGVSAEYPPVVGALTDASGDLRIPDAAHVYYRRVAQAEFPGLDVAGVNAYWTSKAGSFVSDEPILALRRTGTKLLYAFHSFAWHDLPQAWLFQLRLPSWLPTLPFGVLSALALVGMAVSVPRWRSRLLFFALVGCQLGVMVLFYVSARQRILLLPALVFFAIAGCRYLADRSRDPRQRRLTAILAAVLALALMLPTDAMRAKRFEVETWVRFQAAQQHYVRALSGVSASDGGLVSTVPGSVHQARVALVAAAGRRVDRLGDPSLREPGVCSAAAGFLSAILASGELTEVQDSKLRLDAAWLWLAAGEPEKALDSLRRGVSVDRPIEVWLRARALARSGRPEEAVRAVEEGLRQFPGRPELLAERIALEPRGSQSAQVLLERYWSRADGWWLLSRAYAAHGRDEEASKYRQLMSRHFPELTRR